MNQYSYLPFGGVTTISASLPNPFTTVGQFGVIEIGANLFNMRERDYTPTTGQFLGDDPLGLGGGDVNTRRYATNDPVNSIDPTGLDDGWFQNTLDFVNTVLGSASETFDLIDHSGLLSALGSSAGLVSGYALVLGTVGVGGSIIATYSDAYEYIKNPDSLNFTSLATDSGTTVVGLYAVVEGPGAFLVGAFAFGVGIGELLEKHGYDVPIHITVLDNLVYSWYGLTVNSHDPNAKLGPSGYGPDNFTSPSNPFPYRVDFENAPTATAPAQRVDITDQLDPNLDWSTFQWTSFGFGDNTIAIPPNTQHYETTLPMTYNGVTFRVVVTWTSTRLPAWSTPRSSRSTPPIS